MPWSERRPGLTSGLVEASAGRPLVEHLAHLHAVGEQLLTRSFDVGDGEVQALGRAGRARCDVRAKLDRARGARRRELNQTEAHAARNIGVEPPAEAP